MKPWRHLSDKTTARQKKEHFLITLYQKHHNTLQEQAIYMLHHL